MQNLIIIAIVGFIAQLIDGSLGMAYGVTSTTLLVLTGMTPSIASASVHLSEVGTTLAAGISHWKFGNVDWQRIVWLAAPGGIAAFIGAVFLSSFSAESAKPIVAIILFGLGVYILARFTLSRAERLISKKPLPKLFLLPLGLVAGFVDALGGGGWGPIATTTLLSSQRLEPRKVVGTVDTSEFIIALCASAGFLISLKVSEIPIPTVIVMLISGVIAAPLAAWLVRRLNTRLLGTAAGGFILITNTQTFLKALKLDANLSLSISIYAILITVWVAALSYAIYCIYRDRRIATAQAENIAQEGLDEEEKVTVQQA